MKRRCQKNVGGMKDSGLENDVKEKADWKEMCKEKTEYTYVQLRPELLGTLIIARVPSSSMRITRTFSQLMC